MPRVENIFYNIVTDENSTTELLCNLMRSSEFRVPFLGLLLPEANLSGVRWDDIDTQVELGSFGRPDMEVRNDKILAPIEIKVTPGLEPTLNQPKGSFNYLSRQDVPDRCLVFLVPGLWRHLDQLRLELGKISISEGTERAVQTRIVTWDEVVKTIEDNDLATLNPFLRDFTQLLIDRIAPKPVVFLPEEVSMLYLNQIPSTLLHLQKVVNGVQGRGSAFRVRRESSRSLCPTEYGVYFMDQMGRPVLWFGVWTRFWNERGLPLCFGVDEKWGPDVRQAFVNSYNGQTASFKGYIVGWIEKEFLAGENVVDRVWARIVPLREQSRARERWGCVSLNGKPHVNRLRTMGARPQNGRHIGLRYPLPDHKPRIKGHCVHYLRGNIMPAAFAVFHVCI